ncbi:Hypothetical predicted protein, partial [Paramuricea clavata]
YYFTSEVEHNVEPAPHRNSKKKDTNHYVRTWESTKTAIKQESNSAKLPREAVHNVVNKIGGVQSCAGLGQLPRGRQQVKDLKRKNDKTVPGIGFKNISGSGKTDDPWYCLLNECKTQARNKNNAFIRDVRVAAEPLCILASERQLNDLQRFCCNINLFKPLTVDPTFDFGEFNPNGIYQGKVDKSRKEWFDILRMVCKKQGKKFLHHLIAPVRQRAGLGCPPSKFTTNRSERTNGVIQDHSKRQFGQRQVDVFSFSVALKELIDMQKKEIELSVVGKGEYIIRPPYKNLQVTPTQWVQMTQKQQQQALTKIHTASVEDVSVTSESCLTTAVSNETDPILHKFLEAGVDWLPRDVLTLKTKKAAEIHAAGTVVALPSTDATSTVVVPSKTNPKQPHIVNMFPNGKCECDKNCPGYTAESVCAHVIAACLKMSRLSDFLRWFVSTKKKTGGVNYSKAVSFGMPKGRGRKGEAPPRKRKKESVTTVSVERNANSTVTTPGFPHVQQSYRPGTIETPFRFTLCPPCPPPQLPISPPYPTPAPNTFILYFL